MGAKLQDRRRQVGAYLALLVAAGFAVYLNRSIYENAVDLAVYRWGGQALLQGADLYGPAAERTIAVMREGASGLPFTYPPFAALVFAAVAWLPWVVMIFGAAAISLAALARSIWLVLRAAGYRQSSRSVYAGVFILALLMWPTVYTLAFGQINLVLMWLVLEDVLRDDSRIRGALTGFATGVKLTPGIFFALYVVVGSWRRVLVGSATFAATLIPPMLFLGPGQVINFWTSVIWDPARVGSPAFAWNQSLNGLVARADLGLPVWVAMSVVVVAVGLFAARRQWSRWRLHSVATTALAMLLVSPISWTHHWVWAFPALVVLFRLRARRPSLILLISGLALFLSNLPDLALRATFPSPTAWYQFVVGNSYVLWGLAALSYLAWISIASNSRREIDLTSITPPSQDPRRPQVANLRTLSGQF